MKTFTYQHPLYRDPIQHNVIELHRITQLVGGVAVEFTDDKRRKLTIYTNESYVLREEVKLDALPIQEVEEDAPAV